MRLTPRQRHILTRMRDEDEELVYEKGHGWVGYEQVGKGLVFGLLRLMAIRLDQYSHVGGVERYLINETGRELLCESTGASDPSTDAPSVQPNQEEVHEP